MAFPSCSVMGEVLAIVVFTNGKTLKLCHFGNPKFLFSFNYLAETGQNGDSYMT